MFKPLKNALSRNVQRTSSYWQPPKPVLVPASCVDKAPHPSIRVIFWILPWEGKKTGSKNLGRGHVRPNFSFAQSYFLQEDICKMLCCHLQKQREKSFVAIFRNNKKNSLLLSAETMRKILCCYLQKQQEKPFVAICRNNEKNPLLLSAETTGKTCWYLHPNLCNHALQQNWRHALSHRGTPTPPAIWCIP